jgi:hypothetical protein
LVQKPIKKGVQQIIYTHNRQHILGEKKAILMKKKVRTLATIMIVAMLLSIFLPATTLAASADSTVFAMPKTEDVFEGSFSPQEVVAASGETFDVTFSLCPTMDTPNTVISFVLPADLVKLVSGNKVWTGDLKKDETLTLPLSLKANGEVDVCVKAEVEASSSGKDYQSSYYLHVATSNAGFDPMEGGSVKAVSIEYASTASNPESSRATENPQAPQALGPHDFEVKGQFWYLNEDGGWSAGRYMLARVRDADDAGFSISQWTTADGHFDFIITNPYPLHRSPILDFIAEGEWDWKTVNDAGAQYWWSTGVLAYDVYDGWVYENNGIGAGSSNEALQAGDAVYAEAQWVFDRTGWMRSKVTIKWPSGDWPQTNGNTIFLPSKSTAGWNHVSVQHEEGHCVMYALYGHWPPGTGPSPHYIVSESSYGFAMCEGWAEFMQAAVDNNPNNCADVGQNIETNDWYNYYDSTDMDGAIVEGSVASIFWDINDPVDIAGDNDHMGWGFDEIFTVMQNDQPDTILEFWNDWKARWPTNSTSMGPLCSIYYHYGIDKDWYNPWGISISINSGATYTTSRTVTLTLSADDWGVGVKYMRFSENLGATWSGWYTYSTTFPYTMSAGDGYRWIDVQFADFWWISSAIYDGITLDTTKPTGSISINSGDSYATSRTVTLTLSASDATSGVYQMRFSENMGTWGSWVAYATTYSYTLTSTGDGSKSVDVQFKDHAGLISTEWGIWDSITLDTTNPTGSISINSGAAYTTTASVTLYLTYSDATSGVYQVRYGNGGGYWGAWEAPAATKAWTLISGDGSKSVWYQVKDYAGNICDQVGDYITLDTVAPTGSIVINGGAATTTSRTVTLTLSASDATSGVYQMRFSENMGTWGSWINYATTYSYTLTSANDGYKTVDVQFKDNAGLTSTAWTIWDGITLQTPTATNAYLVVRGGDNRIYYRISTSPGVWGSWNTLPGLTCDSPAAAIYNNELHVVVRSSSGTQLYHGYVNLGTSAFSGWTLLSGFTPSAPTLASNGTFLSLVVRGGDNRIYYRCSSNGRTWGSWNVLTGSTGDSPAAAMLGNNLHIVVRGLTGSSLYHIIVKPNAGVVRNWIGLSGSTPSKPVLTADQATNKLYLTVRGGDSRIYWRSYGPANVWAGWNVVPTGTTGDAPAATVVDNKLRIVVRSMTGTALYHGYIDLGTSAFSGWTLLSGSTPSAPTLTS